MFVKIGNEIYDSADEIITIQLDSGLKAHVKKMGPQDDLLTVAPKGTSRVKLEKFNRIFRSVSKLAPVDVEQKVPLQMPPADIEDMAKGASKLFEEDIPDSLLPGD